MNTKHPFKINVKAHWKKLKANLGQVGHNPFVDWKIVFFGSTLLIALSIAFGGYVFYRVDNGTLFVVKANTESKVTTLDRGALKEIIDYFELKQANLDSLKKQKKIYTDPSL